METNTPEERRPYTRPIARLRPVALTTCIGGLVFTCGAFLYILSGKQREENKIREQRHAQWEMKKAQETAHYHATRRRLFKLVDRDKNGLVSPEEQADAWRRMGYGPFTTKEVSNGFPYADQEHLEKAIKNYEAEAAAKEQ